MSASASSRTRRWSSSAIPRVFQAKNEYTFRHALVRDAAYSTLTSEDRALGHHLAAAWLRAVRRARRRRPRRAPRARRQGASRRSTGTCSAPSEALEGNDLLAAIAWADKGIACGAARRPLGALHLIARRGAALAREQRGGRAERRGRGRERCDRAARGGTAPRRSSRSRPSAAVIASASVRIGESLAKATPERPDRELSARQGARLCRRPAARRGTARDRPSRSSARSIRSTPGRSWIPASAARSTRRGRCARSAPATSGATWS